MEAKGKRPAFHIAWGQKSIVSLCTKNTHPPLLIWSQERVIHYNHLRFIGLFFIFFFLCCLFYTLAKSLKKKKSGKDPNTQFLLDIFFNVMLYMQWMFVGESRSEPWSHQMLIEMSVLDSPHSWESAWRPGRMHTCAGNCFNSFVFHQGEICGKTKHHRQ